MQGALKQSYLSQLDAAQQVLTQVQQNALQGLSQAQSALMPTQVPYGTQYVSPVTGANALAGGTAGAGGLDPTTQASQLADLVTSGQLDYNTALSQMGYAGVAGTSLLRNAITAKNPSFNFNVSIASAEIGRASCRERV